MSFTKKYRPSREWIEQEKPEEPLFAIAGNVDEIDRLVDNAKKDEPKQVLLFHGLPGTGKTSTARIYGIQAGISEDDVWEADVGVDYDEKAGVALRDRIIKGKPFNRGGKRLFIIDEIQRARPSYETALLRTLEEPPEDAIIILCTTDLSNISDAILSRCMRFQFRPLNEEEMVEHLGQICDIEGSALSDEVLVAIHKKIEGIPRDALTLLEKVCFLSDTDAIETIADYKDSTGESETIKRLCQSLLRKTTWKDTVTLIKNIDKTVDEIKLGIIGYMGAVLLNSTADKQANTAARAVEIIEELRTLQWKDQKGALYQVLFNLVDDFYYS